MGGMCALCAIWASFRGAGAGFGVLHFGPEGCRPSLADGGSPIDKAEGDQLSESQVNSLFAYVAVKEGSDLDPG